MAVRSQKSRWSCFLIYMEMKSHRHRSSAKNTRALKTIMFAGLIAGISDRAAASTVIYLKLGLDPAQVMRQCSDRC
jgi:hypothetical protein